MPLNIRDWVALNLTQVETATQSCLNNAKRLPEVVPFRQTEEGRYPSLPLEKHKTN
jgi:hypothetical protein